MTCMTPRAFALETIALLKPDSCHAIAAASEPGTPCSAATLWMSPAVTVPGAACGVDSAVGAARPPAGPTAAPAPARRRRQLDRRALDERLVEREAVDARDLLGGDAGPGGQAAEGVAGLDDVGAGRRRGGAVARRPVAAPERS
jgi:hypothetical protein